jgi:thiol-disulfide isomerase/thioredoxin
MGMITVGGHAVSIDLALFLITTPVWCAIAVRLLGRGIAGARASLAKTLLSGVIAARATYVVAHYGHYRHEVWRMLDISDGGFIVFAGFIGVALATLWLGWRQRPLLHPLVTALMAGLLVWSMGLYAFWMLRADVVSLPEITLAGVDGRSVAIQDFSGQPVVVNLWATWCPPCRRELPLLRDAQLDNKGTVFIFAAQAESVTTVKAYLASQGLSLRNVLLDSLGQFAIHVGKQAVPTTLFFNEKGVLVSVHVGELSPVALERYLKLIRIGASSS